jgi:hypothetical protein
VCLRLFAQDREALPVPAPLSDWDKVSVELN